MVGSHIWEMGSGSVGSCPPWTGNSRSEEGLLSVRPPQLPQLQLSLALGPKGAQAPGLRGCPRAPGLRGIMFIFGFFESYVF